MTSFMPLTPFAVVLDNIRGHLDLVVIADYLATMLSYLLYGISPVNDTGNLYLVQVIGGTLSPYPKGGL